MAKNITIQDTGVMYHHGKAAGEARNATELNAAVQEAVAFAALANDEESYSMRWWFGEGLRNYCGNMDAYNAAMDAYDMAI